ncbi:MAG: AI-2E family transporter [Betaproteobacteria bacterium]|nr:AI-2E family transporter [Betaproteobacteria bacterium]
MPSAPRSRWPHILFWAFLAALAFVLLRVLAPILTPFLLAIILAYIFDPLVDRLEARRLPRWLGAALVILLLGAAIALLGLILVPLVQKEAALLAEQLPRHLEVLQTQLAPWLKEQFGVALEFDIASVRKLLTDNWDSAQDVATTLLRSLGVGGKALIGWAVTLLLLPVVMFYVLRDWDDIVRRIDHLIPRPWHERARQMLGDVDRVLAEFLRGQLLVMVALAVYYSLGLWLAGVEFALPVGILTGLLIFIPYVGFGIGALLAVLVAALQLQGWGAIIGVLVVYGIGQVLEGFLLTPRLVGERIGLHPLAVIFALLAFGQLFGFAGVLMALPASAALLVALRELRARYLASPFYLGHRDGA